METAAGAWVGAILGSLAVGLTGLAPLLFIPTQAAISTTQVKDFYKKYKSLQKKNNVMFARVRANFVFF